MTTVLAELGFGGADSRPNFAESITDGILVPDGRWLRYQQKAWPAFSSSGNGTATGQATFPVANTDLFLVRTQVMYFKTPAWSRAFHSTVTPSWHRHVRLSTEITMQESFPNFSGGTSYGEDDVTVGLIYAGESSGKGFAWVYQRLSDGATTRIAHGYFTATGNAGTFNQLGPAVTVAAFTASSTETLEVEMRLDASGGIITHTCSFRGVAVATFTLNAALYNAFMGTSISTNLVNKTFYQGAVARYPGGFAQAAFDTSVVVSGPGGTITSPDITGYSIRQYSSSNPTGILTPYFAAASRHMLFDNIRLVDLNPAMVTPPVDTMPVLVPSFVAGAGVAVSSEDDGGSTTLSLAPDYSQPIEDQYGVSEIKYDSGHTYTRAVYTRRRRAWSLHWEALSPADKSTLETHVTNVKTRFAVFNWVDPETNVTERVRFLSDVRFDRVSFAVWRASAVVEEVLT